MWGLGGVLHSLSVDANLVIIVFFLFRKVNT